jgi:hypothetical protein
VNSHDIIIADMTCALSPSGWKSTRCRLAGRPTHLMVAPGEGTAVAGLAYVRLAIASVTPIRSEPIASRHNGT